VKVRKDGYQYVIVESFVGPDSQGRSRPQVRPIKGQIFDSGLRVECSMDLINKHPLGTKFRIRAKLTAMQGAPFVYSYFGWPYEVVK
jgi:hypothetical protein